jgi:hypothetical protein
MIRIRHHQQHHNIGTGWMKEWQQYRDDAIRLICDDGFIRGKQNKTMAIEISK